jgi:hypothetical protein
MSSARRCRVMLEICDQNVVSPLSAVRALALSDFDYNVPLRAYRFVLRSSK